MSFQVHFWNNIDVVYSNFLQRRKVFKDIIAMITDFQRYDNEYARNIKKIIDYGYAISLDGTLGESVKQFKEHLLAKYQIHSQFSLSLKNEIIDASKTFLDDQNAIGKRIYSEMKKIEKEDKITQANVEKAKAKFHTTAKYAETSKLDHELAKLSYISYHEKEKFNYKATMALKDAKEAEKAYIQVFNAANTARGSFIESSQNILYTFQTLEQDFIRYTKDLLSKFFQFSNFTNKNISYSIEETCKKIDAIDAIKDIQSFIEANPTESGPPCLFEYQPYPILLRSKPIADINYPPDVIFNVIVALQSTFEKTDDSFDPIEEKKKIQINDISKHVCEHGESLTLSEKEILLQLIQDKKYRVKFLYYLNKERSEGNFLKSIECLNVIGDILNSIIDLSFKEEDYESAKYCIILSQTFHFFGKNKEKVFLQKKIEKNETLRSAHFWECFISSNIFEEIETQKNNFPHRNESEEEKKIRNGNIAFSQLLPITDNMLEFEVEKEKIKQIINLFTLRYAIPEKFVAHINKIIDDKQYSLPKEEYPIQKSFSTDAISSMEKFESYEIIIHHEEKSIEDNYLSPDNSHHMSDVHLNAKGSSHTLTSENEGKKECEITSENSGSLIEPQIIQKMEEVTAKENDIEEES